MRYKITMTNNVNDMWLTHFSADEFCELLQLFANFIDKNLDFVRHSAHGSHICNTLLPAVRRLLFRSLWVVFQTVINRCGQLCDSWAHRVFRFSSHLNFRHIHISRVIYSLVIYRLENFCRNTDNFWFISLFWCFPINCQAQIIAQPSHFLNLKPNDPLIGFNFQMPYIPGTYSTWLTNYIWYHFSQVWTTL